MNGRAGSTLYSEVDGIQSFLKYKPGRVGNCHVVVHPEWTSFMYPASFFSDAPLDVLRAVCAATPFDASMRWDFDEKKVVGAPVSAPVPASQAQ